MISLLNELGARLIPAGGSLLVQSILLVGVLLAVEAILRRRIRASLLCALWLLVIVKLLLPPSLKSPTSIGFWLGPWIAAPVRAPSPVLPVIPYQPAPAAVPVISLTSPVASLPIPAPRSALNWEGGLMLGWIAGAAGLVACLIRRQQGVQRLVRKSRPAPPGFEELFQATVLHLRLRGTPQLRLTHAHHSPAVCGLIRPVVLLPERLAERLGEAALRDVLLHELVHLRRRDLWFSFPQALVQVIWWWNPLVWLANARIRGLREQAVDDEVMALRGDDPTSYPATLVEVARHCARRPTLGLGFVGIIDSRRSLRARVDRLLHAPRPSRTHLGVSGWICVATTALLALPMAFVPRMEAARNRPTEPNTITPANSLNWQPWSEQIVRRAQESGRPGLVQFSTGWSRSSLMDTAATGPALKADSIPLDTAANRLVAQENLEVLTTAAEPALVESRSFRVDRTRLLAAIEALRRIPGQTSVSQPASDANVQNQIRQLFHLVGIGFPADQPAGDGRHSLYFNERTGVLFVRAPQPEMEAIARFVESLRTVGPLIQLEVKLVTIGLDTTLTLRFNQMEVNTPGREVDLPPSGGAGPVSLGRGSMDILGLVATDRLVSLPDLLGNGAHQTLADIRRMTQDGEWVAILPAELPARDGNESSVPQAADVFSANLLELLPSWTDDGSIDLQVVARPALLPRRTRDQPDPQPAEILRRKVVPSGETLVLALLGSGGTPGQRSTEMPLGSVIFITPTVVDPAEGNRP